MSSSTAPAPAQANRDLHRVVWLTLALFLSYLCVAMSLPVTSVYVTTQLGFGNALAGLAVGVAFASTIATRGMAGRMADHRGSKTCMIQGLGVYTFAGLVCAAASWRGLSSPAAYGVLVAGRLLLGLGESIATVGLIAWALGLMGPQRSGRVFALVGIGLYGRVRGRRSDRHRPVRPCGLRGRHDRLRARSAGGPGDGAAGRGRRTPGREACALLADHRADLGAGSRGRPPRRRFAAIGAFMPLLFLHRGWSHAGLGLTCFGGAFVLVRILFGHLPDRLGAIPVALVSMAVEAVGQYLLWTASNPATALAGAFLTGSAAP